MQLICDGQCTNWFTLHLYNLWHSSYGKSIYLRLSDNVDNYLLHLLAVQLICDGQWWLAESSEWWNSTEMWKKAPLSHQKLKCLFLDYVQLLMISWAIWGMKVNWNVTKGPLSHQKMKYSFLYYIQLLMISQVIWMTKVDQNAKIWNVVLVRVFCCFSLGLLYTPLLPPDGKVGIRVTKKFRFFRFIFNKFQPKDISVQSLLHLLAMQLICDGQCTNCSPYTFTIYSIQVMANLST